MPTSADDHERPRKLVIAGWEFNRYPLPQSSYPGIERYRLATTDGMNAYAQFNVDGNWYVHLYPSVDDPNKTFFAPATAYAAPADALAVLIGALTDRGYGGEPA